MVVSLATQNGKATALDARPALSPLESFRPLDIYAGGISDEAPRVDAIASISAGFRAPSKDGKPGLPQRSTDGKIHLHDKGGRAPGLAAALVATGGKRLTIAFPHDDPRSFIQQRFVNYSASALLAYGDETAITTIGQKGHTVHAAGTDGYTAALAACKVSVSVYFTLASWTDEGPAVDLVDGFGFFRLRFTSRHSLRNLISSISDVARFTGGRIAGLPFEIAIDQREVADPTGAKRTIPVWTFVPRPPNGIKLTSRNFRAFAGASLEQGALLSLPAPSTETLELAALEGPAEDMETPSTDAVARLEAGGLCDFRHWNRYWHATVKGTPLEDKNERAIWIDEYTQTATSSLVEFLSDATEDEAAGLIMAARDWIDRHSVVVDPEPPVSAPVLPSAADYTRWVELAAKAEVLGLDPEQYTAWIGDPTRDQLRAAYSELRTACIARKAARDAEGTLDGAAIQETRAEALPAYVAARSARFEHGENGSRP